MIITLVNCNPFYVLFWAMFFSLQIWYVDMHAVMATRFVDHSTMKEKAPWTWCYDYKLQSA